jgi:hypothetical protein
MLTALAILAALALLESVAYHSLPVPTTLETCHLHREPPSSYLATHRSYTNPSSTSWLPADVISCRWPDPPTTRHQLSDTNLASTPAETSR